MIVELSIEDAIECFGRERIEKWITNGMQFEHKFQVRQMIGYEEMRKMSYDQQNELLKLNVRVGKEPKRKKLKKIKLKMFAEATKKLKLDEIYNIINGGKK